MATIIGTALDDVLVTTATFDTVTALNGNDVVLVALAAHHGTTENLNGGAGFDRLWFTATSGGPLVLLAATAAFEAFQIVDAAGNAFGTVALDLNASALTTGAILTGNDGANLITGSAKNDTLAGGGGADTLIGGLGDDRIVINVAATDAANAGLAAEGNTLVLVGAAGNDAIIDMAAADQLVSFGGTADAAVQSGFSHVDASGMGGFGVQITGSAVRNLLVGSAGNDAFVYDSALDYVADTLSGGLGNDTLRFSSTTPLETLVLNLNLVGVERVEIADATGDTGGLTALNLNAAAVKAGITLAGNDGANSITGSAFNDKIYGNGGSDTLSGGAGNDIYFYDNASDGVAGDRIADSSGLADSIAFTDTVVGATLVLGAAITGIENAYAMGLDSIGTFDLTDAVARNIDGSALLATTAMRFHGNAAANSLIGGSGADTLIGNGGTDTILGGLGADVVEMDVTSADVIDAGSATEGNTLRLTGLTAGQVVIDLSVAADADQVTSAAGTQSDFTHVDASALTGDFGVTVTGSALGNILVGSGKNDVFAVNSASDFTGADKFLGGGGNDTIRFTSTTDGQTLVLGANLNSIEEVEISDIDGLNTGLALLKLNAAASAIRLKLTGNDGANTITGSNFNDTLNGNGDADVMAGGMGDDEYLYDSAADFTGAERINDTSGAGDSVRFASTTGGEILTLSALVTGIEIIRIGAEDDADTIPGPNIGVNAAALSKAVSAFGDDGDNTLVGTNFADFIEGGKGADSIVGGLGTDTILINVDAGHQDAADAGLYAENNLLLLGGTDNDGYVFVDLSVAQGVDQSNMDGIQTGFSRVDASAVQHVSIEIVGRSVNDTIIGGQGDDRFTPGLGVDFVNGGGGNDSLIVRSQAEMGTDTYFDSGVTRGDYIYFDSAVNGATLTIGAANVVSGGGSGGGWDVGAAGLLRSDTTNLNINASAVQGPFGLAGNAGRNILTGTRFGESLFDYGGADTMIGGLGSDDYVIVGDWVPTGGTFFDKIVDTGGDRDDLYNATTSGQIIVASLATMSGIERFVVSGADLSKGGNDYVRDIEALTNGGFDLTAWNVGTHIAGSFGNNSLTGTKFADTMIGHKGEDTILAGLGTDVITMEVGTGDIDVINAGLNAENNRLILKGDASGIIVMDLGVAEGADQLTGIGGTFTGGATPETLLQTGFRHVDASAVALLGVDIVGSAVANTIIGTGQDDRLDGRAGADTLVGGGGNDFFVVNNATDYVAGDRFDGGAGILDTVRFASVIAGQTLTVLAGSMLGIESIDIEDATGDASGGTALNVNATAYGAALKLNGNAGNNLITGTAFADTLAGGGGADTLRGGAGNDVYLALAPGEVVAGDAIADAAGTSDVFRFISGIDGEVVLLTSLMTGLEIAETATATGALTAIFDTGVNASAVPNKLTMRGNAGDNQLTGTAFADVINGGLGADTIAGGAGADTITMALEAADMDDVDGGAIAEGNLLVLVGRPAGNMVWDLSNGVDQLISVNGVDEGRVIRNITHLDASGVPADPAPPISITVTGSAQANILVGGAGNDIFIEKSAADFAVGERITGAAGNDVLRFTSTGTDTLVLTTLVTGIESVQISDAAGVLTGTSSVSVNAKAIANALKIEGNDGANALTGTNFNDTIIGGGGSDTIVGGTGNDVITMQITVGSIDAVNAGLVTEINKLVLEGVATGLIVVNLALTGDQLLSVNGANEALVQSGFVHLDAGAVTGGGVSVNGTAGNNLIIGTALADTIVGGAGNDTIGYDVGGGSDVINAGALTEVNSLLLTGAAPGTVVVDLSLAGDQVTAGGLDVTVQSGFTNVDASAMTGAGMNVTGSSAANIIVGSAQADTISGGAGADRITWDAGTPTDSIDAGEPGDGDTFVIRGTAAGPIVMNLAVAPGADQLISINAVADNVAIQSDFQHLDARELAGGGLEARGNALNNTFYGSKQADILTGMAGADTFWLGGGYGKDAAADRVVYERPEDGFGTAGAPSFDVIREFKTGQDAVVFTGAFNGGPSDLDDIGANDVFLFATNAKANFSSEHEALLITAATARFASVAALSAAGFSLPVLAINNVGVISATGDDGLIVVQAGTAATGYSSGVYYYQESDGILNRVAAGELTLLGVFDAPLASSDFVFV